MPQAMAAALKGAKDPTKNGTFCPLAALGRIFRDSH